MFELSPLLIPIFALLIPIVAIWTRHQQKMAEMGGHGATFDDSAITAQADKVARLEERVKVLERIVTDGSQGLALSAQIDALRQDHSVPLTFDKEQV
ncbi:MAG: hypothetical protein ABIT10_06415 [Alteraurantiacibacter sp.]